MCFGAEEACVKKRVFRALFPPASLFFSMCIARSAISETQREKCCRTGHDIPPAEPSGRETIGFSCSPVMACVSVWLAFGPSTALNAVAGLCSAAVVAHLFALLDFSSVCALFTSRRSLAVAPLGFFFHGVSTLVSPPDHRTLVCPVHATSRLDLQSWRAICGRLCAPSPFPLGETGEKRTYACVVGSTVLRVTTLPAQRQSPRRLRSLATVSLGIRLPSHSFDVANQARAFRLFGTPVHLRESFDRSIPNSSTCAPACVDSATVSETPLSCASATLCRGS